MVNLSVLKRELFWINDTKINYFIRVLIFEKGWSFQTPKVKLSSMGLFFGLRLGETSLRQEKISGVILRCWRGKSFLGPFLIFHRKITSWLIEKIWKVRNLFIKNVFLVEWESKLNKMKKKHCQFLWGVLLENLESNWLRLRKWKFKEVKWLTWSF